MAVRMEQFLLAREVDVGGSGPIAQESYVFVIGIARHLRRRAIHTLLLKTTSRTYRRVPKWFSLPIIIRFVLVLGVQACAVKALEDASAIGDASQPSRGLPCRKDRHRRRDRQPLRQDDRRVRRRLGKQAVSLAARGAQRKVDDATPSDDRSARGTAEHVLQRGMEFSHQGVAGFETWRDAASFRDEAEDSVRPVNFGAIRKQ